MKRIVISPRHYRLRYLAACIATLLALLGAANAEVILPKILGDNMVLQRGQPVPIWGHAKVGEKVTVQFAGQEKHAAADTHGNWRVNLDPLAASVKPGEITITASNTLQLHNILVGEVWLCSGQSNMEMPAAFNAKPSFPSAAKTDAALAADAKIPEGFPGVRLFRAEKDIQPEDVVSSGWTACQGDALAKFSAIGYIFAREIQRELGVPVGIIQSAWGGTRIEAWTPPEGYAHLKVFAKEAARQPIEIDGLTPGKNYAGLVKPLTPFALRGVLWYQGESNIIECNDGIRYADKMQALIDSWRSAWNRSDLPFFYVQVAPYSYSKRAKDKVAHSATALPELWEAQEQVLRIPHTGMVPTVDLVTELHNLHPQKKREIAVRLSKLALAEVYGQTGLVHSGPIFEKLELRGDKAVVHLQQVGSGLKSRDGQPLTNFEIAGVDGNFVTAQAVVEGKNTIVVSSTQVGMPKAVRFSWNETANPNLFNAEGWPAFPFRSNASGWAPQHP